MEDGRGQTLMLRLRKVMLQVPYCLRYYLLAFLLMHREAPRVERQGTVSALPHIASQGIRARVKGRQTGHRQLALVSCL